jgi:molecular chaperone GrpE
MTGTDPVVEGPVAVASEGGDASIPPASSSSSAAAPPLAASSASVAAAFGEASSDTERRAALRALRSLEATEARLQRTAQRDAELARGKLIQDLLPVLDNLDRTLGAAYAHRSDPAMIEGVTLVRHQLESVLRGYGVERVDAADQPFDPSIHEAIGVVQVGDPRRHGFVVQQVEPGYRFAGQLLRPAKVNVGKFAAPAAARRAVWR